MNRKKVEKKRYTTYLFPQHFAALKEIADLSDKSVTQVLTEALETYLKEVDAFEQANVVPPTKAAVAERLRQHRKNKKSE